MAPEIAGELGAGEGAEAVRRGDIEEPRDAGDAADAESNRLGGGPGDAAERIEQRSAPRRGRRGSATISPFGSTRKMSAASRSQVVSATRKEPVEMSIQASAWETSERAPHPRHRHQEIGPRRRQQPVLGDGARRHQPDDVAPDHRFRAALPGPRPGLSICSQTATRKPAPISFCR
jgi:hypothetical protein